MLQPSHDDFGHDQAAGHLTRLKRCVCWEQWQRAISPTLFQWESQNATSEASRTGQRYIHHRERGSSVHLFFRASKEPDGELGAPAYLYAGPATYVTHSGERPMRILWKLAHELPADVFHDARVAAG